MDAYDLADNPSQAIETRLTRREFGRVSLLCMLTGSTVFGRGTPKDTDYVAIGTAKNVAELIADGWEYGGSVPSPSKGSNLEEEIERAVEKSLMDTERSFVSLKKGGENIILTRSSLFLDNWTAAHDECCERQPYTKAERIAIFRKHLYGEQPK